MENLRPIDETQRDSHVFQVTIVSVSLHTVVWRMDQQDSSLTRPAKTYAVLLSQNAMLPGSHLNRQVNSGLT